MNGRKLKLGFLLGFYAFITFTLLLGIGFSMFQLYLINPILLVIALFLVIMPILIVFFNVNYKIVKRD